MNLTRRGFLKTCLALGAAPAIMSVAKPMKLWVPPQEIYTPPPLDYATLNDGNFHIVRVMRQWLGTGRTRFFFDDREVAGIEGVSITNDCVSIKGRVGDPVFQAQMPRYQPGRSHTFMASVKCPAQQPNSMLIGSAILQDESGPAAYTAQTWECMGR